MDKKIDEKIDDLAIITKKGFDGVDERFKSVETRLGNLENGQEEIKVCLDKVAYRFKLVVLEKRVERLDAKTGIA